MTEALSGAAAALWEYAKTHPHAASCWAMGLYGVIVFPILLFVSPPWGRHYRRGWGAPLPATLAWITQELPSLVVPLAMLSWRGVSDWAALATERPELLLPLAAFLVHYVHRALIFPLRLRGGKPTPSIIWALAVQFCIWNGYNQGQFFLDAAGGKVAPGDCPWCRVAIGMAVWAAGAAINVHSDYTLIGLRREGESGYKIPCGGMFSLVSCPNHFGEAVEWTGYAIACWSLPGGIFAFYTAANTWPRAWHHHLFYKRKFEDYPPERKAVVPFIW